MVYRVLNKNDQNEIKEYHRMRFTLWPHHDEDELYQEMFQILKGKNFYKNELFWTVFVAERNGGGLGGFIEITLYPELKLCDSMPIGFIEGLYVDEDLRKNGVGKRLIERAEKFLLENNCTEIASDVEFHNTLSQQVHKSLGFQQYDQDEDCFFYKRKIRI